MLDRADNATHAIIGMLEIPSLCSWAYSILYSFKKKRGILVNSPRVWWVGISASVRSSGRVDAGV